MLLPINVVVKHSDRTLAFVGDGDAARFAERHCPIAVARAAKRTVADRQRLDVALVSMSDSEEISERHVDAGSLFTVVIYAQTDQAGPREFVIGHCEPDVA